MGQNHKNNETALSRLIDRLVVDKKKGVMALCLVTLMVFMWIKVLSNKSPQTAGAATIGVSKNKNEKDDQEIKISYKALPLVQGRNDILSRDFFKAGDWSELLGISTDEDKKKNVDIVSKGSSEQEIARRVTKKLKLDAIMQIGDPRVFINDKLLSVGDKLFVDDGKVTYRCEIVEIEASTVVIRCLEETDGSGTSQQQPGAVIKLKLTEETK